MRFLPDFGRLGIGHLLREHYETFYELDQHGNRKLSWSDIEIFLGIPTLVAAATYFWEIKIRGLAEIIGGMAILTALLFGLLVHVFTLGLRLADNPQYTTSNTVTILIDELRANVSYACGTALTLTVVLVVSAALADKDSKGLNVLTSSVSVWLFAHLSLTLFMVINRVRSAYRMMAI